MSTFYTEFKLILRCCSRHYNIIYYKTKQKKKKMGQNTISDAVIVYIDLYTTDDPSYTGGTSYCMVLHTFYFRFRTERFHDFQNPRVINGRRNINTILIPSRKQMI